MSRSSLSVCFLDIGREVNETLILDETLKPNAATLGLADDVLRRTLAGIDDLRDEAGIARAVGRVHIGEEAVEVLARKTMLEHADGILAHDGLVVLGDTEVVETLLQLSNRCDGGGRTTEPADFSDAGKKIVSTVILELMAVIIEAQARSGLVSRFPLHLLRREMRR